MRYTLIEWSPNPGIAAASDSEPISSDVKYRLRAKKSLALLGEMASKDGRCGPVAYNKLGLGFPSFAGRQLSGPVDVEYARFLYPRAGSRRMSYVMLGATNFQE